MRILKMIFICSLCAVSCSDDFCTDGVLLVEFVNNGNKTIDIDAPEGTLHEGMTNSRFIKRIEPGETGFTSFSREVWSVIHGGGALS